MEDKNQAETIKKNLENPVFTDLDALLDKSRAKLISFSLLGFFIFHYDINIKEGLSFLGITIKNITINDISIMVVIVLVYMLINFIWMSWNRLMEWRIRKTGVSKELISKKFMGGLEYESPNDVKQASLYYYWVGKEKQIEKLEKELQNIEFDVENCQQLNKNLEELKKLLSNSRIKVSLEKFDETFWNKIKSENFRWVVFDFILPIIVCCLSIVLLLIKLWDVLKC
ncbi:hypothetical protein [Arcobacter aquimarinus]|uniref:hypothetical protein n=1 Tax=Arcobacter aquimarinus TaxID=1315211 RepID=UPI003BAE5BBC